MVSAAAVSWSAWWEDNKDDVLADAERVAARSRPSSGHLTGRGRRESRLGTARPDADQVHSVVLPSLLDVVGSSDDGQLVAAALLAAGRSATGADAELVGERCLQLLRHHDQSVQATAALTLGVLRQPQHRALLESLLYCQPEGHKAVGDSSVPWRVRAMSALALGLLGQPESAQALTAFIDRQGLVDSDTLVCSILALGLAGEPGQGVAYDYLVELLDARGLSDLERSFVPSALAKLGDRRAIAPLCRLLEDSTTDNRVTQSCALALGALASIEDQQAVDVLTEVTKGGHDVSTRNFSLIGLGRLGARDTDPLAHPKQHAALLKLLTKEALKPSQESNRSWAALGLALYAHAQRSTPAAVLEAVSDAYERERDPAFKGAAALGLGLLRVRGLGAQLHHDLLEPGDEDFRGYACVALGLMGYTEAAPTLRSICADKAASAALRLQAARGLGLMRDAEAVPALVGLLGDGGTSLTRTALAQALGVSGDKAAIPSLRDMAQDDSLQESTRAAACLALGMVGQRERRPWFMELRADLNYLSDAAILDFLSDML